MQDEEAPATSPLGDYFGDYNDLRDEDFLMRKTSSEAVSLMMRLLMPAMPTTMRMAVRRMMMEC